MDPRPPATDSPDDLTLATPLDLPIRQVLVMEDRALVTRLGTLTLPGGQARLVVRGLSPLALDRSLSTTLDGGRLFDARLLRRWRARPAGGPAADASALRRQAHELALALRAAEDQVERHAARAAALIDARGRLLAEIAANAGAGRAEVATWSAALARVSDALAATELARHDARRGADDLRDRQAEAQAALDQAEAQEPDLECALALLVEGAGSAQLRVCYQVPCAVWRPAYRATLRGETVLFEAEAVLWQRSGEDWDEVALELSTARPSLGHSPPVLHPDRLASRPKSTQEKKVINVALREELIQTAGETGGQASLPGLDDGGEARLLRPAGRHRLPSDGQPQRVALFGFEAPASLERVCPAELSPLVSLVARFPNRADQVLLAGPVDLLRSAGTVGRGQLRFVAPGETIALSFGSEDGLRVVRASEATTSEARLTGRQTTTRTVTHHVSNASDRPVALLLEERVPVSEVEQVRVEVLTDRCDPAPISVSPEGIARLLLELPAHGTRRTRFVWSLSAAASVQGL